MVVKKYAVYISSKVNSEVFNKLMLPRKNLKYKAEKSELLDRIMAFVEKHYAKTFTIGDLAKKFYVSRSTISHLFQQKMGISFYRFVTQRRLIAAKSLIETGMLLENVALQSGFPDYSNFYRAFKQEYGISPRQYRNQCNKR